MNPETVSAAFARGVPTLSWLLALMLCAAPAAAGAMEFGIKAEAGVATSLTAPQNDLFGLGGSGSVKALFGLSPILDVGPTVTTLRLPSTESGAEAGGAWGLGGGLRLKRPHDAQGAAGISPWFDFDALYIRTGALNRPGFDAALGVSAPIGARRVIWVGPFVRYLQVIQPEKAGFDNHDAKVLSIGLSFEAGRGIARSEPDPEPAPPAVVAVSEPPAPTPSPDRDGDTVPDDSDRCPDVAGDVETFGCPPYKGLIVHPDKLELRDSIYFEWDKATLEPSSYVILDEVVRALNDNPGFRVDVEGHADSTGANDYNQTLSEARADRVRDYLIAHGIAKERLISIGFGSTVPDDTNTTALGREHNRRVEFLVQFIIVPGSIQ